MGSRLGDDRLSRGWDLRDQIIFDHLILLRNVISSLLRNFMCIIRILLISLYQQKWYIRIVLY